MGTLAAVFSEENDGLAVSYRFFSLDICILEASDDTRLFAPYVLPGTLVRESENAYSDSAAGDVRSFSGDCGQVEA